MNSPYVGKTLAEVQKLHPNVRVRSVGKVQFMGTCDFRPDRLNVELSGKDVQFENVTRTIGGKEYTTTKIVGTYDHAVVLSADFG